MGGQRAAGLFKGCLKMLLMVGKDVAPLLQMLGLSAQQNGFLHCIRPDRVRVSAYGRNAFTDAINPPGGGTIVAKHAR